MSKQAADNGNSIVVPIIMDGDFVADYAITEPFPLFCEFKLEEDGGLIKELTITGWDPSIPTMMSVWVNCANEEDPLSSLRISRRPIAEPPQNWVKVKMHAVGLNYHDIWTLKGHGMHPLKFPLILGCEGAGTLEDGTEVLLYPVMGDGDFKGDETLDPKRNVFSELTNGTLAEYVNVPQRNVVVKPKDLHAISASVLGIAWLTGYRMLFTKSALRAGQTMLVQGSSGGVTTSLIQMGAAAGMRVWATGRTAVKRELALKLGAERVFASGEDLPEKVDAVFDTSGVSTWRHTMASVKTGGTIVTWGGHSGRNIPINATSIFVDQLSIRGSYLGTLQEFKDLIAFVVAKGVKPHIGHILPFEEADDGLQKIMDGAAEGKVVITFRE